MQQAERGCPHDPDYIMHVRCSQPHLSAAFDSKCKGSTARLLLYVGKENTSV